MSTVPRVLETHAEWRSGDVADASGWTVQLTRDALEELDAALRHARTVSDDLMVVSRDDFPLPTVAETMHRIERELIDGRGFVLIRGLERDRYTQSDMELLYWGIGMHLGRPWPQNAKGHVLGDVTDQGKGASDPTARGNEIGGIELPYHSDGSDLVGLMCLSTGASGGTSAVANAVAIHNDLVRESPDLAAALYADQPYDFRGEQAEGGKPWYLMPTFSECGGRLFVRYIRPYIAASQRHEGAPRVAPNAVRAMDLVDSMANDPSYNVFMDLEPGDLQFVNNYHVLHARKAYRDDREAGRVRHLKRLWLETRVLEERPVHFQSVPSSHWEQRRSVSRIDVTAAS